MRKTMHVPVQGAPFQPGDRVKIIQAIDQNVMDLSHHVGKEGGVFYLDYASGCGQSYPADPMIGVRLATDEEEVFWREELELIV